MTELLAQEIVKTACNMEEQNKSTRMVFATLTYYPTHYPARWKVKLPEKSNVDGHVNLPAALGALAKNGFTVEVDKVNQWLGHIEKIDSDKRSRMVFSKLIPFPTVLFTSKKSKSK